MQIVGASAWNWSLPTKEALFNVWITATYFPDFIFEETKQP